jgi:hypothetical protein
LAENHNSIRFPFSKPTPSPAIRQRGSGSGMIAPGGSIGGSIGSQQHGLGSPHVPQHPPTLMQTKGPSLASGSPPPPIPESVISVRSTRI